MPALKIVQLAILIVFNLVNCDSDVTLHSVHRLKSLRQQSQTNPCTQNPCLNGGICAWLGANYMSCVCSAGWTGPICQYSLNSTVNPCSNGTQICKNGGTCTPSGSFYYCNCPNGYYGATCQLDGSTSTTTSTSGPVTSTPTSQPKMIKCEDQSVLSCKNGGVCYYQDQPPYSLNCRCPATYTGAFCQTRVQFCSSLNALPYGSAPCQNGGTCMQNSNDYEGYCNCPSGTFGNFCEAKNCTTYNPCHNNNQCMNIYGLPYCFCVKPYDGVYCENKRK